MAPAVQPVPDCQSCGACCAYSWEWPTFVGVRDGEGIPAHLKEDGRMRCDGDRCAALIGTIGVEVQCRVYEDRPLVCMEFAAGSDACRAVRTRFGLDGSDAVQENHQTASGE
ncbi:MAG TPA: YkgJ family cysteine cluster protein [Azospirillum sp.]